MTEEEFQKLEKKHYRADWRYADARDDDPYPCYGCGFPWPCEASQLVAEIRRLRGAIKSIEYFAGLTNNLGLSLTITQALGE